MTNLERHMQHNWLQGLCTKIVNPNCAKYCETKIKLITEMNDIAVKVNNKCH